MPDWTSTMTQTFEFYEVDPATWKDKRRLDNVKSCTINRDSDSESLGSATIDIVESVGECYIRVYLITIQNGIKEKHPLGTFLVQTPSSGFNGKIRNVSMDAYTPLLELKEDMPSIGFFIPKGENIMETAYKLTKEHLRAPVIKPQCDMKTFSDFVADTSDTWMKFLTDFMASAKYEFGLDEMSRVLFVKKQDATINTDQTAIIAPASNPVWTYTDDNSSILHPDFNMEHDLYGIPNVIEVLYSNDSQHHHVIVANVDPDSPTSIENRGREILHRVINPDMTTIAGSDETLDIKTVLIHQIEEYAARLLIEQSTIEYTVSYTHGYCPVRVGDCVRLNYNRSGLTDIKAKVISQSIQCRPGCPVSEKAVFTTALMNKNKIQMNYVPGSFFKGGVV